MFKYLLLILNCISFTLAVICKYKGFFFTNTSLNRRNIVDRIKCDMCKRTSLAQYHLTMSDATVRNFCTYQCVMSFQVSPSFYL